MANPQSDKTIDWIGGLDGAVEIIDQTLLPGEPRFLTCPDVETLWEAIRHLRVRGAPAIGIAAAMGVVLGTREATPPGMFFENLTQVCDYLASCRPTAVNLVWALNRMRNRAELARELPLAEMKQALLAEARSIRDEL